LRKNYLNKIKRIILYSKMVSRHVLKKRKMKKAVIIILTRGDDLR